MIFRNTIIGAKSHLLLIDGLSCLLPLPFTMSTEPLRNIYSPMSPRGMKTAVNKTQNYLITKPVTTQ